MIVHSHGIVGAIAASYAWVGHLTVAPSDLIDTSNVPAIKVVFQCPHLSGRAFPEHPLLDKGRTVQHRDALRHAGIEKPNGYDIHELHLVQIQNYSWSGSVDFGLQLIDLLSPKLAA